LMAAGLSLCASSFALLEGMRVGTGIHFGQVT
jgi:hypothetical protein